jgi:filamentous hemagglutinin
MRLQDLADLLVIDQQKFTKYALNPENERGSHKARVFEAVLGYTKDNYQTLVEQVETKALDCEAVIRHTDAFGQHIQVDIEIVGITNQQAVVRTGWLVQHGSNEAHLVTLYVRKAKK